MNSFKSYQNKATSAFKQYKEVGQEMGYTEPPLLKGIEQLYKPFKEGRFTLAVIGKMSAGKSTLINALLGKRILPEGHFQTTCVLTRVHSSEKKVLHVSYASGRTVEKTINLTEELRSLVAIPDEYSKLPLRLINNWICEKKWSADEIIKHKSELENEARQLLEDQLIRGYCQEYTPDRIPTIVQLSHPLSPAYDGWDIVDTPGIGAIGGV